MMLPTVTPSKPPFGEFYDRLPPVTRVVATSLLLLHFLRVLTGTVETSRFSLSAAGAATGDHSFLTRLVTGPALHASFLHVTFNCLAICHIGGKLETGFGTVLFFLVVATCWIFSSFSYVGLVYAAYSLTRSEDVLYQSAIGFSGVIFALAVIESRTDSSNPTMEFFGGRVRLSRFLVPFALILVLQLLLPNVSLIGHVAGALFGLALSRGGIGAKIFPSRRVLAAIDESRLIKRIFSSPATSYKPVYSGEVSPFVSMCDGSVPWLFSSPQPLSSATTSSSVGYRLGGGSASATSTAATTAKHAFTGVGRVLGTGTVATGAETSTGNDEETVTESSRLVGSSGTPKSPPRGG